MKFASLKQNPVFYFILAGFAIMVFVEWPLLHNAYKGKEKDFNDKLFLVVSFVEESVAKDTVRMKTVTTDSAAINFVLTVVKRNIDSAFTHNDIRPDYVIGIGKLNKSTSSDPFVFRSHRDLANTALIWSSDHNNDQGLLATKLRLAHIGPKGSDVYVVKIFLPSKPSLLFKQLLPLIIVSAITLLMLFVCFLVLISIIRKQSRLAEVKNDFINNMTHELKTPLFTISIASKMLAEHSAIKENTKFASYIESIQEETGRLTKLVDKVLQASALEKKQLQLDKKELDMHTVIRTSVKSLELIREEQNAVINLSLQAEMHIIDGDETHIAGVIYSLVDNAFKYSNGPAHITISTINRGNHILVSFVDKGIGFDLETKGLIFERFFRAHTGNLHHVKGYGIGLSYVKTIIDAHKGSISVNSKVGKGSEFILILPYIPYGNK
ncbi:MAG: HAMP domain-containing sensor histidine kinase [Sediminibacterium sp.]